MDTFLKVYVIPSWPIFVIMLEKDDDTATGVTSHLVTE